MELCLGTDEVPAKTLWVRIKGQTNMDDTVVGICCRLPYQEEVDEVFRQLEEALHLQALVFMEGFNHHSICWRGSAAGYKRSRRFLKCTGGNFLTQVIEEMMRRGALLDFFTDKEELVGKAKVGGSLGCSDHEMMQFRILKGGSRAKSMIPSLDFRRGDLGSSRICLEESHERLPWRKE